MARLVACQFRNKDVSEMPFIAIKDVSVSGVTITHFILSRFGSAVKMMRNLRGIIIVEF